RLVGKPGRALLGESRPLVAGCGQHRGRAARQPPPLTRLGAGPTRPYSDGFGSTSAPVYAPLPTLMIGQLRTTWASRSVSVPFFSTALICVSLVSRTGVAPAFQVRIVSDQSGE